ncbi:MAG: hypothetical protein ACFE9Z_05325 [Promethearchaeota archaeon]
MESKLHTFEAFQIYSTGARNKISLMVDCLWIENDKIFFRIVEGRLPNEKYFKKENSYNVYSISKEDLISIRCRLYF